VSPAAAGICGIGVAAVYVPIFRDQIRDGEIGIPLTGTNPIKVRRDEHPLLFRFSIVGQIALVTLIMIGSLAAIVRSFIA